VTLATTPIARATYLTPHGEAVYAYGRPDTSDGPLLDGLLVGDEYRLRELPRLSGWAIDLGAHIGAITLALLADNPELQVIAVEPLAENLEVLALNVAPWADRVHVHRAQAGDRPIALAFGGIELPDDYRHANRFVAGPARAEGAQVVEAPRVTLGGLLDGYGVEELSFLKTDCEGGEWAFLDDPAVARVKLIRGEYHDDGTLGQAMVELLAPTHDVTLWTPDRVVGLFEAVRR
jgi:FkbM family methyltransferase